MSVSEPRATEGIAEAQNETDVIRSEVVRGIECERQLTRRVLAGLQDAVPLVARSKGDASLQANYLAETWTTSRR